MQECQVEEVPEWFTEIMVDGGRRMEIKRLRTKHMNIMNDIHEQQQV